MTRKLIFFLIILFTFVEVGNTANIFIPPSGTKPSGWTDNGTTTTTDRAVVVTGTITSGETLSEESVESSIWEVPVENDADATKIGGAMTVEMTDETATTEDTVLYLYRYEGGSQCVAMYFGPPMAAAPSWTPCTGCRVLSDGNGSDPWDVAGGVYYTGAAWVAD